MTTQGGDDDGAPAYAAAHGRLYDTASAAICKHCHTINTTRRGGASIIIIIIIESAHQAERVEAKVAGQRAVEVRERRLGREEELVLRAVDLLREDVG